MYNKISRNNQSKNKNKINFRHKSKKIYKDKKKNNYNKIKSQSYQNKKMINLLKICLRINNCKTQTNKLIG